MNDDRCFFVCSNKSPHLQNCTAKRVETIRKCSIIRGDGLSDKLVGIDSIRCHKSCVSTYTSNYHISRVLSKSNIENITTDEAPSAKRLRRSDIQNFSFKEHCFICGEKCISVNSKHPDRWREVYQCRTVEDGSGGPDLKKKILSICDHRKDAVTGNTTSTHQVNAHFIVVQPATHKGNSLKTLFTKYMTRDMTTTQVHITHEAWHDI